MSIWDDDAAERSKDQLIRATEDAYREVATSHAGKPVAEVRAALVVALNQRFDPGTGPDAQMIDTLAEQIHKGE